MIGKITYKDKRVSIQIREKCDNSPLTSMVGSLECSEENLRSVGKNILGKNLLHVMLFNGTSTVMLWFDEWTIEGKKECEVNECQ